jgi:restriction system protein
MPIPDYETLMLPFLQTVSDGTELRMAEVRDRLAERFQLSDAELEDRLPSGQTTVIASRVGWAKTYLKNAGLLEQPSRGRVRITEEGRKLLAEEPRN